ncbi:hypothetical protein EA462_09525 [Natrarchaeobius halalkaliphilus]|uniref:DUF2064 domain-containing protein n=1 Tax=Natrarchaeobius halalkaliphilus TaxID=1679091 RepID=A0A3N6M9L6_9EURY|nr:hypothetical protein [Natrarchaeobius halalkaliphilus]RQG90216.1 hypothetical protein EA462_09525 [Natrarchaeobius halalkaliphilus]
MIVVVPVAPPRTDLACASLVETTPLTDAQAVALYEAAVTDVLRAAAASGGDLLVNYRDEGTIPDGVGGTGGAKTDEAGGSTADPEDEVRTLVGDALESVEDVRFERQVGSSHAARIGNTVTHLLEREDAGTVGVLEPTAPLVGRSEIDSASMSLRRYDAVLGPSSGGRVYFAGFCDPIDFTDAYATPSLATLARGVEAAGLNLGFAPVVPTIATESGLCATIAALEARRIAGRPGATATGRAVDELGLTVGGDGRLERE